MSNGWKLELHGNETQVYLNFWDSLRGDDSVYILKDGKAFKRTWEEGEGEELVEKVVEVNLIEELIALNNKLNQREGR